MIGCCVRGPRPIESAGLRLDTLPQIQLPAHVSWEAADGDSSVWSPVTHMGDADGVAYMLACSQSSHSAFRVDEKKHLREQSVINPISSVDMLMAHLDFQKSIYLR